MFIDLFKDGSKIHIKKKNKGKFTQFCNGKVTEECIARGKRSKNPITRKRANFAANARKWKHQDGGTIDYIQAMKNGNTFYNSASTGDYKKNNDFKIPTDIMPNLFYKKKTTIPVGNDDFVDFSYARIYDPRISPYATMGKRNNNPLSLRITSDNWIGRVEGDNPQFLAFDTMANGFRAGFINMKTRIKKGDNTLSKLITAWAPQSDGNNTEQYIADVAKDTGLSKNSILDPNDKNTLTKLAYAMTKIEMGEYPDMKDVIAGWNSSSQS